MDLSFNSLTWRPEHPDREPAPAASHHSRDSLARLVKMSPREIGHRGWQEASKWVERLGWRRTATPDAWLHAHAPALARPDAALDVLRQEWPRRFFAGVSDPAMPVAIAARCPDDLDAIVQSADRALDGRFDLLGYRTLSFGNPIDWHLDPVSSRRAPLAHWSQLDPLDAMRVGDSKVVWELNRHQWLTRLAQAWALTGQERYAAACVGAIDAWHRANPVATGLNWSSSLEIAYRLIAWCWTAMLIRKAPMVTSAWVATLMGSIGQHAEQVRRRLSCYSSPNTHLTGEALGLFYAGALLPECPASTDWRETGLRVLIDATDRQLTADGVHFEQSTCYHAYTLEMYAHLLLLAGCNGITVPVALTQHIGKMADFLMAVRQPDGSIPSIGDEDGGRVLPLVPRATAVRRELFSLAAVICRSPDFAWASDGATPEVCWMSGSDGLAAIDALTPAPPPDARLSAIFPLGGYAVMRSDWSSKAHHLIVDVGPLGCPTSGGHGHADLLSVQCAAFGEPWLMDAGTYCYTADSESRDFFRSTAAHSTVRLDGLDQAEPAGPFKWRRRPQAHLRAWHSDQRLDVIDADHDAYRRLPDPVTCRRRVVFVKPHYWVVIDDLEGAVRHQVEVAFQCGPSVRATPARDGWVRLSTPSGAVLWIWSVHSSPVPPVLMSGQDEPARGWTSDGYGQRRPSPLVLYSSQQALPCRVITLLFPDQDRRQSPPEVSAVFDRDARPAGLEFQGPLSSLRIDAHTVTLL